jgi:hypothetical protein
MRQFYSYTITHKYNSPITVNNFKDMLRYDYGMAIKKLSPTSYEIVALKCTEARWSTFGYHISNYEKIKGRENEDWDKRIYNYLIDLGLIKDEKYTTGFDNSFGGVF